MAGRSERSAEFFAYFSRFEIELEFLQSLANPLYLNWLASKKLLEDTAFIEYLRYLQYFKDPKYLKFLQYPGPSLRALELLQHEKFRHEILAPATVDIMLQQGFETATAGLGK